MRRFMASLLAALFGFSLIGPALFVDAGSSLPACCRRDGKHRCSMLGAMSGQAASSRAAAQVWGPRCPYFPSARAFPPLSGMALLAASQSILVAMLNQPALQAQAEAGYRISFSRAHQKRGPPSLLF